MSSPTIRPAFSKWPEYNRRLRDIVAGLTDEQLAIRPSPERWPLWAIVGHLCCQRISWLCGFLDEPGAESTPFPDALYRCPGDEYLEPAMSAQELAAALDSTFAVVDRVLDSWTLDMLDEEIRMATEVDVGICPPRTPDDLQHYPTRVDWSTIVGGGGCDVLADLWYRRLAGGARRGRLPARLQAVAREVAGQT
jgi:hypothetical protein